MIAGGLKLGQIIVVQGFIPTRLDSIPADMTKRSCINLKPHMGSDNDIHLHMSIRFDQNCIVRNTKQAGRWGTEELVGGMPLSEGEKFQIMIAVHPSCFKIYTNGHHFTDYNHRVGYQQINTISFTGDIRVQCISFQNDYTIAGAPGPAMFPTNPASPPPAYTPNLPIVNPPVPYGGCIPGGLYPGRMITIQGKVHPKPGRFHINLMLSGDIAFHFNPRFNGNYVVRNTRIGGKYGPEERGAPGFPFVAGAIFDVKIQVEPYCYKVAVNNRHFCEYNHRLNEFHLIQGLEVEGDVGLHQIIIQ